MWERFKRLDWVVLKISRPKAAPPLTLLLLLSYTTCLHSFHTSRKGYLKVLLNISKPVMSPLLLNCFYIISFCTFKVVIFSCTSIIFCTQNIAIYMLNIQSFVAKNISRICHKNCCKNIPWSVAWNFLMDINGWLLPWGLLMIKKRNVKKTPFLELFKLFCREWLMWHLQFAFLPAARLVKGWLLFTNFNNFNLRWPLTHLPPLLVPGIKHRAGD